ncbi:unnamed protein product [Trichobilharzia szidati]|nr:unnamed protein product [Trichobilharzia szidati]
MKDLLRLLTLRDCTELHRLPLVISLKSFHKLEGVLHDKNLWLYKTFSLCISSFIRGFSFFTPDLSFVLNNSSLSLRSFLRYGEEKRSKRVNNVSLGQHISKQNLR